MIICIVGPTGVGKTKMSIELAKKFNGEVINADSTQVFKSLDIATAKVTEKEKEGIPHHLFDIKNIDEDYTVFDYQKDARVIIDDIISRGKTPIIVGGTGLYIKALLYDYKFEEESNNLNNYDNIDTKELYERLIKIDPKSNIHINNRKRIVRALNYYEANNKPMSEKEKTDKLLYNVKFIGLTTDRTTLYDRINKRVDVMLKSGLIEEAKKIYNTGIRSKAVMTPIGYKELFLYFDSSITYDDAIELIKQRSRRYAKRQYTWFNNQMDVAWFDVDFNNFSNTVDSVVSYIEKGEE
ncbi:MAG: tRNA (adenosine(37)-N6)-dimethylallyltransferase MiaA [Bacilli bacterium]|nr:tRNA (adenosine(37)-N6)-dimethylallyltransferase MiaA [Bacilli bacterium]